MSQLFDSLPRRAGRSLLLFAVLAAAVFAAGAAEAGESFATEGVRLRLLAEPPRPDGRFRAALVVDLEPGWKTYWLDPGEGGLPPKLAPADPAAVADFALRLPVPHRTDDAGGRSNVYSAPFAMAIEGRSTVVGLSRLGVKLALGVCRSICIPVSAELDTPFPATAGAGSPDVEAAFAVLPRQSTPTAGVVAARMSADRGSLLVSVRPADTQGRSDLFVAGPKGWSFGAPVAQPGNGETRVFALPVLARPRKHGDTPDAIHAILVAGQEAWSANGLVVANGG